MRALLIFLGVTLISGSALAHPVGEPAESADQIHPLLIGAKVPRLELQTGDGTDFDLNAAIARQQTILIFYRGGW